MATFRLLFIFDTLYALLCLPSLSNELPFPKADAADTATAPSWTPRVPITGDEGQTNKGSGQSGPIAIAVVTLVLLLLLALSCAIKIAGGVGKDQRLLQQQVEGMPHQGPHGFGRSSPDFASIHCEPNPPSSLLSPPPPPYQVESDMHRAQREMGWGREVTWRREQRGHISIEDISQRSSLQHMSVFTISGQLELPRSPFPAAHVSTTTPTTPKLPPPYSVQDPCSMPVCI
ncbi:uncharacterized protein LOC133340326 [Lethenteron reissneri]|uniref:uncharacterized protein LOC133340326 n=1 Tax=Lethenteron reissneri TaxID=7753 RepID=UPI002AB6CA6F|nr:uncharacterized protein LOC133340326 [Lethenteron reissneri]